MSSRGSRDDGESTGKVNMVNMVTRSRWRLADAMQIHCMRLVLFPRANTCDARYDIQIDTGV